MMDEKNMSVLFRAVSENLKLSPQQPAAAALHIGAGVGGRQCQWMTSKLRDLLGTDDEKEQGQLHDFPRVMKFITADIGPEAGFPASGSLPSPPQWVLKKRLLSHHHGPSAPLLP